MENANDVQRMNGIRVALNYGLPYDMHSIKKLIKQVTCRIKSP